MAKSKKNITPDRIVEYLLAGGDASSAMKQAGINQIQLVAALLSRPDAISKLRNVAVKKGGAYEEFDPTQVYNPEATNDVEERYKMWGPKYQGLIQEFFNTARATGGGPETDQFLNDISSRAAEYAPAYGVSENELISLTNALRKDKDNFVSAEVNKKQSQFSAFQKQREELAGDYGSPTMGAFAELTGTPELLDVPTSIEQLAKQRAGKVGKKLSTKFKGMNEAQLAGFEKAYAEAYGRQAKAKKIDPTKVGTIGLLKELMKKTLG